MRHLGLHHCCHPRPGEEYQLTWLPSLLRQVPVTTCVHQAYPGVQTVPHPDPLPRPTTSALRGPC